MPKEETGRLDEVSPQVGLFAAILVAPRFGAATAEFVVRRGMPAAKSFLSGAKRIAARVGRHFADRKRVDVNRQQHRAGVLDPIQKSVDQAPRA